VSVPRQPWPCLSSLLLLLALSGLEACSGDKAAGAAGLLAVGMIGSGGAGLHCDIWGPVPRCMEDSPADLVARPPPKDSILKPIP
jgi:hypothetical protein